MAVVPVASEACKCVFKKSNSYIILPQTTLDILGVFLVSCFLLIFNLFFQHVITYGGGENNATEDIFCPGSIATFHPTLHRRFPFSKVCIFHPSRRSLSDCFSQVQEMRDHGLRPQGLGRCCKREMAVLQYFCLENPVNRGTHARVDRLKAT